MFGFRIFKEQLRLSLIWIVLFSVFWFSAAYLPGLLPESLGFLASALALLAWFGIMLVLFAFWGMGPLAKRLNQVAIEEDEKERKKYHKVKQPWQ